MTESDPRHESPRDRKRLARQAGLGRLSFISALAGVLVAHGAFALLAALVGAVAVAIGLDTELASNDWTTLGRGSAITVTVVAFVAYLFGGYVAGRMARRAGLVNGLAVFALAVLLVLVVGAIAASQTDTETVQANLRSLGLPITGSEWARIGTAAGIGTLVGMLVGAGIGGVVGVIAASQTDTEAIQANLRGLGLPITGTEWARIGTAAGIGTLVGMLVGASIGGVIGERWHSELVRWAAGVAPISRRVGYLAPAGEAGAPEDWRW